MTPSFPLIRSDSRDFLLCDCRNLRTTDVTRKLKLNTMIHLESIVGTTTIEYMTSMW